MSQGENEPVELFIFNSSIRRQDTMSMTCFLLPSALEYIYRYIYIRPAQLVCMYHTVSLFTVVLQSEGICILY